ncbi:hypothetical protein M622_13660 [Thauera terpenica 58Eu]|uniref:Cytochrome c-552/DMSO reductase-like haem-binding domain-containing protein n=1 Tax=Thauera terpenica 58Eu TaxID=1348657 RepID=S9ZG03_9RHOO|nr:hypothetical protein M622_13660 [Thauera terpenica 58Eu]
MAAFAEPGDAGWARFEPVRIDMIAAPLVMQPTEYIRNSWQGREYGADPGLEVAAVHDGLRWAVRVSWTGVSPGGTDFPDALALALPVRGNPVLMLMGAEDAPIHFLRWQANKPGVKSQLATGIGQSTNSGPELDCSARALARDGRWHVVITRVLGSRGDVAPLEAGGKTGIGFAVWRGGNDERGGIKAFSIDWAELVLDA